MKKLAGRAAIVTGASKGIGAAVAKALAAEGAAVAVIYSSGKEGAERLVSQITREGGKASAIQADVSKAADVKRMFEKTKEVFGSVDVLVNNPVLYPSELRGHAKIRCNIKGLRGPPTFVGAHDQIQCPLFAHFSLGSPKSL